MNKRAFNIYGYGVNCNVRPFLNQTRRNRRVTSLSSLCSLPLEAVDGNSRE